MNQKPSMPRLPAELTVRDMRWLPSVESVSPGCAASRFTTICLRAQPAREKFVPPGQMRHISPLGSTRLTRRCQPLKE